MPMPAHPALQDQRRAAVRCARRTDRPRRLASGTPHRIPTWGRKLRCVARDLVLRARSVEAHTALNRCRPAHASRLAAYRCPPTIHRFPPRPCRGACRVSCVSPCPSQLQRHEHAPRVVRVIGERPAGLEAVPRVERARRRKCRANRFRATAAGSRARVRSPGRGAGVPKPRRDGAAPARCAST